MKSYSISSCFFALNVLVAANPLIKRATFGQSSDSPLNSSPDGGLLAPPTPGAIKDDNSGGPFCGVQLYEFTGDMRPRGDCTEGLAIAGGIYLLGGSFAYDGYLQGHDPDHSSDEQNQCCLRITCTISSNEKGYCTNSDKSCVDSSTQPAFCPGSNTKCCIYKDQTKATSALPTSDLLASSDLSPVDPNTLIPAGDQAFTTNDNLYTIGDGSAFNPDESQLSYGVTNSILGNDETAFVGMNGDSGSTNLFANLGEESPLETWS